MKYIRKNERGSFDNTPIFGKNKKGRIDHGFISFYQIGNIIIMSASKNPDRREIELKKQYGYRLNKLVRVHSFKLFEEKRNMQLLLDIYRITKTDRYCIDFELLKQILSI